MRRVSVVSMVALLGLGVGCPTASESGATAQKGVDKKAPAPAEPEAAGAAEPEGEFEANGLGAAPAASGGRTLSFSNECSFPLWIQSVGSNASVIPCSPTTDSAQANCPANFICYAKDANTNYCVPGTTTATKFPVSSTDEVTLDASQCLSGAVDTDTKTQQWGQCTCASNSECPANQICQPAAATKQCFWGYTLPDAGKLEPGKSTSLTIAIPASAGPSTIVGSGKFFAKASCDVNGSCLSDNTKGAPATLIEYTFQNDNDWYDVSYINGVNAPAVIEPSQVTTLDYESDDPYRCMAAGGLAADYAAIAKFQSDNGITGNDALAAFACTNAYAETFTGDLTGFNAVYSAAGATACSSDQDCSAAAGGATCGLSLSAVTDGSTALSCGDRVGYWSYTQLCAANSSYVNTTLGIDCADAKTLAYAECVNQASVSDTGPGRSCFNANTTSSGETCCGYDQWSLEGTDQPLGVGDAAVAGVDTSYWTTNILPAVKLIKQGCYLAYSFQFDDPFSTFTCATTGAGNNATNYTITLCPGSDDAGIAPPTPTTCTPTVAKGFTIADFTIGVDTKTYSLEVTRCDGSGTCTTPVSPSTGDTIFTATAGASDNYQVKVTNTSSKSAQACTFSIPTDACIGRVTQSADCGRWSLATDGAWAGRSIAPPAF